MASKEQIRNAINQIDSKISNDVFQFDLSAVEIERYLKTHAEVPFVIQQSIFGNSFIIAYREGAKINHQLITQPDLSKPEFNVAHDVIGHLPNCTTLKDHVKKIIEHHTLWQQDIFKQKQKLNNNLSDVSKEEVSKELQKVKQGTFILLPSSENYSNAIQTFTAFYLIENELKTSNFVLGKDGKFYTITKKNSDVIFNHYADDFDLFAETLQLDIKIETTNLEDERQEAKMRAQTTLIRNAQEKRQIKNEEQINRIKEKIGRQVIICSDFDGTITGRGGEKTVGSQFYASLLQDGFQNYGFTFYKHAPMRDEQEVQKLFKAHFGEDWKNPKQDADMLMKPETVDFYKDMLNRYPVVDVYIITRNRDEYIKALLQYQGFTQEEISRVKIIDSKDKFFAVRSVLNRIQDKASFLYILDDSIEDYNEMINAAKQNTNKFEILVTKNKPVGTFEWGTYHQDILDSIKTVQRQSIPTNHIKSISNVNKLTEGYANFFKREVRITAFSPYYSAALGIAACMPEPTDWSDLCKMPLALIVLSPILLPLTAVTSAIALLMVIGAAVSAAFAYPIAAIMDCCNSENDMDDDASRALLV